MAWQRSLLPLLALSINGKNGQALKPRPVNNARADKLDRFM